MTIELALECVKLAIPLVSPSVEDRFECIAQMSGRLYSHIKLLSETDSSIEESNKDKPKRGRPPKPLEVEV